MMALPTDAGEKLTVKVFTPKGVVWEGEAEAVSSVNSQGPFDLLPQHAHFISLIEKKPITVVQTTGEKTFDFEMAVVRLIDNVVTIYADIS